ncbi:MAG: bifunctional riboflavin kinase/FAD synthetase [Anaerolineaceae bacterium]|nr:bifunctional riboflavin kinase/FAD synthetase [Anaerolineaceae bacterium]
MPTWATIGNFDGVHSGHQALIIALIKQARANGIRSALITFSPHPHFILSNKFEPYLLSTSSEKLQILNEFDLDLIVDIPFTREFAQQSGESFLNKLNTSLGLEGLVIGKALSLGYDRLGKLKPLQPVLERLGIQLMETEALRMGQTIISSGLIRDALTYGKLEDVLHYLGRAYQISGKVIYGKERGASFGLPTANLAHDPLKLLPGNGVYACRAWVEGRPYDAVTNVGVRPTFESDGEPNIEAHLFDFDGNIYGKNLTLSFISKIRDEIRFENPGLLIIQISKDKKEARRILKHAS